METDAERFMLAEYSLLQDFRASVLRQMETRLNIFFAAVSGIVAALALLNQTIGQTTSFFIAAFVLLLLLFMLGVTTFNRIVYGHISVTWYTRGINSVRRYFVKLHKEEVGKYISQPVVDTSPRFGSMGFGPKNKSPKINRIGLTAMSILLNSLVTGMLGVIVVQFLGQVGITPSAIAGVLAFIISLAVHERYLKNVTQGAEENYLRDQERNQESIKNL